MATPKDLQNAIAAANKELRGEIRADLERLLADSLVALRDGTEEGPFTIKRHPTFLRAGQSLKHLFGK